MSARFQSPRTARSFWPGAKPPPPRLLGEHARAPGCPRQGAEAAPGQREAGWHGTSTSCCPTTGRLERQANTAVVIKTGQRTFTACVAREEINVSLRGCACTAPTAGSPSEAIAYRHQSAGPYAYEGASRPRCGAGRKTDGGSSVRKAISENDRVVRGIEAPAKHRSKAAGESMD